MHSKIRMSTGLNSTSFSFFVLVWTNKWNNQNQTWSMQLYCLNFLVLPLILKLHVAMHCTAILYRDFNSMPYFIDSAIKHDHSISLKLITTLHLRESLPSLLWDLRWVVKDRRSKHALLWGDHAVKVMTKLVNSKVLRCDLEKTVFLANIKNVIWLSSALRV